MAGRSRRLDALRRCGEANGLAVSTFVCRHWQCWQCEREQAVAAQKKIADWRVLLSGSASDKTEVATELLTPSRDEASRRSAWYCWRPWPDLNQHAREGNRF